MVKDVSVSASLLDDYFYNEEGQHKNTPIAVSDYYVWLKKMPEVAGVVNAIINDVMGDGFELRGSDSAVNKANDFLVRNKFKLVLYSVLQDLILTGDGYLGVKRINEDYAYKKILAYNKSFELVKSFNASSKELFDLVKRDSDFFLPRGLFALKSSTMFVDYDKHGVVNRYIQKVNGDSEVVAFSPDEVIHFSLNNIGNEVYGNTPFNACLNDIATLWYAKDYAGKFFENDGSPDKVYILKNSSPNSSEYKAFEKQLKLFKKSENKHRSMLMTGEVDIKDVNSFNKDLEFNALIDKFTQRIMMAWNMPPCRLSDISGNYRSSKDSIAGYYKNISRLQELIEEYLNSELFYVFGKVKLVFFRAYKRDESVEADIVAKLVGKPVLSINEGRQYLGHDELDGGEYDKVSTEDKSMGEIKGKLPDSKEDEEVGNQYQPAEKLSKRSNVVVLDSFFEFKSIVEADNRKFNTAKVFVSDLGDSFNFVFSDSVGTYECLVKKEGLHDTFYDEYVRFCLRGKLKETKLEMVI